MARNRTRAQPCGRVSPTPLITADDVERMWAAIVRPRGDADAREVAWNEPGAVARFVGSAYRALHEITMGLNDLMANVDAADRAAQLRACPMGDGFDFAALRDLTRAAGSFVGSFQSDQFYDDYCNADEELARREDARSAAAPPPPPAPRSFAMPFLGDIGHKKPPARLSVGGHRVGGLARH